jgi:hypothetical protein
MIPTCNQGKNRLTCPWVTRFLCWEERHRFHDAPGLAKHSRLTNLLTARWSHQPTTTNR